MPQPSQVVQLPAFREVTRGEPDPQPGWEQNEESMISMSHYLWIVKRHWWKILAFIGASVAATFIVSSRITPIFESTATIDIDRQMPTGVIGQESTRTAVNDADQFLATQIRMIQSDSVLRPVEQEFRLLEHERGSATLKTPEAEEAPVTLKYLKVLRPANTYNLLIKYRSADRKLASAAANAIAKSYLEHTYDIRYRSSAGLSAFMEKQLNELKAKMEGSTAALLQFERELNVINPEEKTSILSARLLQLNTEYTNAQTDRVRKETAFQSVKDGSVEAAKVSSQGEPIRKMAEQLGEWRRKFTEIKSYYGTGHPEYKKVAAQIAEIEQQIAENRDNIVERVDIEYRDAMNRELMLGKAVAETKTEFDQLNARSFEYQAIKRGADADKKLYEELVRKIKEASINASFQNNSIRIADPARPGLKAVLPDTPLNVLLAFLFSTLLAMAAVMMSDSLDTTIRDPEQVARILRTQVIGCLPSVRLWNRTAPAAAPGKSVARIHESADRPTVNYKEAIRTLRNSVLLTDFDRRLRTILVTSASPSEGKSTAAAHLAAAHAEQRHRTLLIDGDMRRPNIHNLLQIPNGCGLSDVLVANIPWRQAVVKADAIPDLDVLPAGPASRRAADLMGKGLTKLLDEVAQEYDLVILDGPPFLGFAEPLQMAAGVDGVIVVTRVGDTSRKAVGTVLSTLIRLRANMLGVVLNNVHKTTSDGYYYYGHGAKYYAETEKG